MSIPPFLVCSWFLNLNLEILSQCHSWKFDLEVMGEVRPGSRSHTGSNILANHIPLVPWQSSFQFLKYMYVYYKNSTLKIQGQIMGEIWVQGNKMAPDQSSKSYPFHSMSSIRSNISLLLRAIMSSYPWDMAISIFDLENQRSRSWVRSKFKVTLWPRSKFKMA